MTDLAVDSKSFWENIQGKLDRSRFLIVLCSPNAAKSPYIDNEVRHFLQDANRTNALEHVIPVILAGNPGVGDDTECLPPVLLALKDRILKRNLPTMLPDAGRRPREGWENGLVQTVSYLLGVDRVKIADRYQRAKRRQVQRFLAGAGVLLVLFAAISAWALLAEHRASENQRIAVEERDQKETARADAVQQRRRAEQRLALATLTSGLDLCERGQIPRGLLLMARSLEYAPNDDADLQWLIRSNLAGWRRHIFPMGIIPARNVALSAISPNGRIVATVEWTRDDKAERHGESEARVWDSRNGRSIAVLSHSGPILSLLFSPDGSMICTGSSDGTLRLWNAADGKPLREPMRLDKVVSRGHMRWPAEGIAAVRFSTDGRRLCAANGAVACVWDVGTGKPRFPSIEHGGTLKAIAISAGGHRLLTTTTSYNGFGKATQSVVYLYDADTGKRLGDPWQHPMPVRGIGFDPRGEVALTVSEEWSEVGDERRDFRGAEVRAFRASDGSAICPPMPHSDPVESVIVGKGPFLVTASGSAEAGLGGDLLPRLPGRVFLWNLLSGQMVGPAFQHDAVVHSATVGADDVRLFTGAANGTARYWNIAKGSPIGDVMRHDGGVYDVAFAYEGRLALTRSHDHATRLWHPASGRPLAPAVYRQQCAQRRAEPKEVIARQAEVWDVEGSELLGLHRAAALANSADGKQVLAGGKNGLAVLWDVADGAPTGSMFFHGKPISIVEIAPDGRSVLTKAGHGFGRYDSILWSLDCQRLVVIDADAQYSPDGKRLLAETGDAGMDVWDAHTGQKMFRLAVPWRRVLAFSPDGSRLLAADDAGAIQLCDSATGKSDGPSLKSGSRAICAVFSPDSKRLLTGHADGATRLWDFTARSPIGKPMRMNGVPNHLTFSADGDVAITGNETIQVAWNLTTGRRIDPNPGAGMGYVLPGRGNPLVLSPDGKRLASADSQGAAQLFNLSGGNRVGPVMQHRSAVRELVFSPDGHILVTLSGEARLWSAATGLPLSSPLPHGADVSSAAFSPDS